MPFNAIAVWRLDCNQDVLRALDNDNDNDSDSDNTLFT